jgi:hypothetical protein
MNRRQGLSIVSKARSIDWTRVKAYVRVGERETFNSAVSRGNDSLNSGSQTHDFRIVVEERKSLYIRCKFWTQTAARQKKSRSDS